MDIQQQPKNNNNNTVGIFSQTDEGRTISVQTNNIVQFNLNNQPILSQNKVLGDKQMHILKAIAWSDTSVSIKDMVSLFRGKIHENTIRSTIDLFEEFGWIIRKEALFCDGRKYGTIADNRFKFYVISEIGMREFDSQLKIRGKPLCKL